MSLQIKKITSTSAIIRPIPPAPDRILNISPTISGQSSWNLDSMGPLNIGTAGIYTITPSRDMVVDVKMWGAGGTGSYNDPQRGGGGGYSSGRVVLGNVSYIIVVGESGKVRTSITSDPTTIGGGRAGNSLADGRSMSGGGLSGLFVNAYTHANSIIVAGGGAGNMSAYYAGAGGGSTGQSGNPANTYGYGTGGTQSSGGTCTKYLQGSGSAMLGGRGRYSGGGGGFFGGAGAGSNASSGGGSGFIHQTVTSGSTIVGNMSTPAMQSDTYRSGSGIGGGDIPATNGRVVIF